MATVTDRARGTTGGPGRQVRLSTIRVSLGTMTEAVTAQNFGLTTLFQVHPVATTVFGGSNGTFVTAVVRNPGSEGARASVSMVRIRTDAGTAAYERKLAGTITVDLAGFGF